MATIIKRIYEIQDIGKGLIDSITEDNLLLIYDLTQNLQGFEDVLVQNPNLTFGHIIQSEQQLNIRTDITEFLIDKFSAGSYPFYPLAYIGIGRGNELTESSFAIFDEIMEIRDTRNNKGVSYAGDYEANFVARSLITRQFLENRTVTNSTTTALSASTLNSTYSGATIGFKVQALSISGGGLIYEKTSTGWAQYSATVVV